MDRPLSRVPRAGLIVSSPGPDVRVEVLTRGAIVNTFGGGVNEVLRDLICTTGLGMPRGSR